MSESFAPEDFLKIRENRQRYRNKCGVKIITVAMNAR